MRNLQKKIWLNLAFCLISYCSITFASPKVLVSIKPIHSLVASVMQGVATPTLLLPDYASPHTFQLKPSNLKQLQEADLVIWIGPDLETFLEKPLADKPAIKTLALQNLPQLKLLALRTSRNWQVDHSHHDSHTHNVAHADPHFWLSTENAQIIVQALADILSKEDPLHAKQYQENAKKSLQNLKALHTKLNILLKPVRKMPFLVYHDGYQYFEKEFQLNALGTMVVNPQLPLSAHGLKTIQDLISDKKVRCVFRETEFSDKTIYNSLQNMQVKVAELDPLGAHQKAGPPAYEQTMMAIGETMAMCLRD